MWFECAAIAAVQDAESFVDEHVCIPKSLSKMTSLTSLQVQSQLATNVLSCLWLSQLKSLKEWGITCPAALIKFPSFCSLSSLEYVRMDLKGVLSEKPELEEEVLVPLQSTASATRQQISSKCTWAHQIPVKDLRRIGCATECVHAGS